jgi:hypothetical protein
MALPFTVPTFYRMPDVYLSGASMVNMLTAVSSSLTSLVDYRGMTIPNTHKWTWATASTGGTFTTIYNTAVPTSSSMTQNPTFIFAGSSGSFTPTMNALDTYAVNTLLAGINKNGTTHTTWTGSLPMTTGSFTGYVRMDAASANAATTYIRTYISPESIFMCVVAGTTTQYWTYGGVLIEPYTSYTDSVAISACCETDDRIYGVLSSAGTAVASNFLSSNAAPLSSRGTIFNPTLSTVTTVNRRTLHSATGANMQIDNDGNYIFERIRFIRAGGATVSLGTLNGVYYAPYTRTNQSVLRQNNVDLYHLVCYADAGGGQAVALKAAS